MTPHVLASAILLCASCGDTSTLTSDDAESSSDTGSSSETGALGDTGSSSDTVSSSDGGSGGDGSVTDARVDAGPDIPVKLPGNIAGVEPESHSHHPPMIDGKGALYRVTESTKADGNNLRMMRSTDQGATWSEVDTANRPSPGDIEGSWQLQVGTTIYVSVANSNKVWFTSFHTSDAVAKPDTWALDEVLAPDLKNGGGVVQFSSLAHTSGQFWLFHSDTLIDNRQQIGFSRRSANGVWGAKQRLGATSGSWTGPRPVVGNNDVTHVFYKDHLNHQLYWSKLSATGTLSAATRVDVGGTSQVRIPQTVAVHYKVNGAEVVAIAYADAAGALKSVTVTDSNVATPETISSKPVLEDPSVARNDGTVAHLSVEGTTIHALWTDLATGDILHSKRAHGGAWSTPVTVWASGNNIAWWVYGNVYERSGRTRLGFTYDVGVHADDVGDIKYNEITLTP